MTPNWTPDDVLRMLDCVEEILPLGGNGWSKVAAKFNACEVTVHSRADVVKRKFVKLKNVQKPTGDPSCPIEVLITRSIRMRSKEASWRRFRWT